MPSYKELAGFWTDPEAWLAAVAGWSARGLSGLFAGLMALAGVSVGAAVPSLQAGLRADGRVELDWPAGTPVELETTATLGPGAFWEPAIEVPQALGDRVHVVIDGAGAARFFRLRAAAVRSLGIEDSSPFPGEEGVAVTRETVFRLNGALAPDTVLTTNEVYAVAAGRRVLSRPQLGADRRTVTLFYLENLPASSRVETWFDGTGLFDDSNRPVDLDGDGVPGGRAVVGFVTVATGALATTGIEGRVLASERGPDGADVPLVGVTITVDGEEETLRAVTDTNGTFRLQPAPAGRFFVHVDGRTARGSDWPRGAYYPFIGKAWEAVPGRTNNLAGGTGLIFLPRVQADALQVVSETEATRVTFAASVLATNPALAGVEVAVPANALFADNGTRGGRVGIAPVPPDRLPEPLPPGLNLPLVITIQTDGAMNFDVPVPVRFPNLPDPVTGVKAPPGTQLALWSFNHDTGRWEVQGPATVTADGLFVVSDEGVGVRQPGWHGVGPGCGGCGTKCQADEPKCPYCPPPDPPPDPKCERSFLPFCKDKPCFKESLLLFNSASDAAVDLSLALSGGSGSEATDCIGGAVITALRATRDCMVDLEPCGDISAGAVYGNPIADGALGAVFGCIPKVGSYLAFAWTAKSIALNLASMRECVNRNMPRRSLAAVVGTGDYDAAGLAVLDQVVALLDRQIEVSEAASNLVAQLQGATWAVAQSPQDLPVFRTFFQSVGLALSVQGEGGLVVTPAERAALLQVPRPNGATEADVDALLERYARMQNFQFGAGTPDGDAFLVALARWEEVVEARMDEGWQRLDEGLLRALQILLELAEPPAGSTVAGGLPRAPFGPALAAVAGDPEGGEVPAFPVGPHFFSLIDHRTGFIQRGRLSDAGQFPALVLGSDAWYSVHYFDPRTGRVGASVFRTPGAGRMGRIPAAILWPPRPTDRDQDGLPDDAEVVVGTALALADTDGDGSLDGAELAAGTNPSDGQPLSFGVVASRRFSGGSATDLCTLGDLAIVSDTGVRVMVMDVANPLNPVERSRSAFTHSTFAVSGARVALGVVGGVRLLSVGSAGELSDAGLVGIGRDNPPVAAAGRYFVAGGRSGNAGTLVLLEHDLPVVARTVLLSPVGVVASQIRVAGDIVWILTSGGTPQVRGFRLAGSALEPLGAVDVGSLTTALGQSAPDFALGPGKAFVGDARGLRLVDITDPAAPVVRTPVNGPAATIRALASNGGGFLLAGIAGNFSVLDVRGNQTTNVVFGVPFASLPTGLAMHRGYGLVAAGSSGLNTVHFVAPDRGSVAPGLTLRAHVSSPPALQEASQLFLAEAVTTDDVQVRDVEFEVDDLPAARAGGFPFQTALRAPALTPEKTSFTVRARVTDMAGNTTWSDRQVIALGPDVTPPRVMRYTPANNSVNRRGSLSTLSAVFDSLVTESSLAASWTLTEAGPDGRFGTADDRAVTGGQARFEAATRTGYLEFSAPLISGVYRSTLAGSVLDQAGNASGTATTWGFSVPTAGVTSVAPVNGEVFLPGTWTTVTVGFDEVLDRGSLTPGNFQLLGPGPDGRSGTADDALVSDGEVRFAPNLRGASLVFPVPVPVGGYRVRLLPPVLDVYGGSVKTNLTASYTVKGPTEWAFDRGGAWEAATNWNTGARPIARDYVVVDRPAGDFPVTLSSDATVTRLRSTEPFTLSRVLTALDTAIFEAPLTLVPGARLDGNLVELGAGLLLTSGTGDRTLRAKEVRNAGLVLWKTGGLAFGSGTRFRNLPGAEFRIDKAGPPPDLVRLGGAEGGNEPAFLNEGLFRKVGGTERIPVESLNLDNTGRIAVEAGTLELSGFITNRGTIDVAAGTTFVLRRPALNEYSTFNQNSEGRLVGPGRVEIRMRSAIDGVFDNPGTTRVETAFTAYEVRFRQTARFGSLQVVSPLILDQGAAVGAGGLEFREDLSGAGTLRVDGPSLVVNSRIGGGLVFQPAGGLVISNALLVVDSARWENSTAVRLAPAVDLVIDDDAEVANLPGAVLELADGARIQGVRALATQTARFHNRGRVVKPATPGQASANAAWFDEGELRVEGGTLALQPSPVASFTGSVEIADGARLSIQEGLTTFAPGSRVGGPGEVLFSSRANSVIPPLVAELQGAFEPGRFTVSNALVRLANGGSFPRLELARQSTLETGGDLVVRDQLRIGFSAVFRRAAAASNRVVTVTARAPSEYDYGTLEAGVRLVQEGSAVLNRRWQLHEGAEWVMPPSATLLVTNGVGVPVTIDGSGSWAQSGTVVVAGPGFANLTLATTNTGLIELRGGVFRSSRRLVLADGELRLAGGQLEVDRDNILGTPPLMLVGGTVSGTGSITAANDDFTTLTLTNVSSVIRPGSPIGVLRVTPHFSQWPGGVLEIEIAGAGAGVGHDQLAAGARARMLGTLRLVLRDGFVPAVGQEFDIVTGTSIGSDRFNAVEGSTIAPDRHFEILYQSQRIVARCVAGP